MKYITGGFVGEEEAGQRLFQVIVDPRCTKSGVYWSWNGGPREGLAQFPVYAYINRQLTMGIILQGAVLMRSRMMATLREQAVPAATGKAFMKMTSQTRCTTLKRLHSFGN
jgi:hypothetical protein